MIFVTLGSQKFQFNRLLVEIDELIEQGKLSDDVFAQIGYSDYIPKNYEYKKFLDREEFAKKEENSDIVITHGGTGAIMGALKNSKKVIAVPRLAKYGEHVDDHQIQLIKQFKENNLILSVFNLDNLGNTLKEIKSHHFNSYKSNTNVIIDSIDKFIRG